MSLGSIFAWSLFNSPLTLTHGVIVPGPEDWTISDVQPTFSLIMAGFAWGAVLGNRLDRLGPRASCLVGAGSLGAGFALCATAAQQHSLPLLYAGGLVWGMANGWSYVPPVSTLINWFPERKGLASAACTMGFGGGAFVAAPLMTHLLTENRVPPERVGDVNSVDLVNEGGRLYVDTCNAAGAPSAGAPAADVATMREVVVATSADAAPLGLEEGIYLVGTGDTGIVETLLVLGGGYSLVMAVCALVYRLPSAAAPAAAPATAPSAAAQPAQDADNYDAAPSPAVGPPITTHNVAVDVATRTPQFWTMWFGFGFAITGSYGIIAFGKTMLHECFGTLPVVNAAFAASFVAALSAANIGGRFFWSAASDALAHRWGGDPFFARKVTFGFMWGMGPLMYLATLGSIYQCQATHNAIWLYVFSGGVLGIMSSFGGAVAARPAMTGDLFGTKNVGVLTARQLSVVAPAAFLGPKISLMLREDAIGDAIHGLAPLVPPTDFTHAFGLPPDQLDLLVEQKTVTINRLMELVPPGTVDPTPFVYDKTLLAMAGLQAMAFLCNAAMRPVDPRLHIKEEGVK